MQLTQENWRAVVLQKEVQILLIIWSRGLHVSIEFVCPWFHLWPPWVVTTLICTLHSFSRSCCLTLKVFLRGRSWGTMSAGGSGVLESCSDLLKSIRSALRLKLDFEIFWLHFKGWGHCTSLPHVVSIESVTRSHNMYRGLWAVFGAWLPSGDQHVEWFPKLCS